MGQFGICRHSIIPVRSEPSHRSELVTQLLFGEHYTVLDWSNDKDWAKIENHFDRYTGWIASNQYNEISPEYFDQINNSDYKICTDVSTTILLGRLPVNIVIGSIIPIGSSELFRMEEKLAFTGEAKSLSQKRDTEFLIQMAHRFINTPYLWGGRSPYGIDCSGFVQLVYRLTGYRLPRDTGQQIKVGEEISYENRSQGDLVFFENKDGKMDHVGIVHDEEHVIHASGKVRIDILKNDGITNQEIQRITHFKPKIRRIIS